MPCNNPNKIFYIGINPATGNKKILFTSRKTTHLYRKRESSYVDHTKLYDPAKDHEGWTCSTGDPAVSKRLGYDVVESSDLVPCGQCLGCRMDYARMWAARMMCEARSYEKDELWFVTCTYDDDHLPKKGVALNYATGAYEESPFNPLSKKDHQNFVKQVRDHYGKVRYCCSGEYGSESYRPHIHYIFFGLKLDDIKFYKRNWRGDSYYTSEKLSDCWTEIKPGTKKKVKKGFVVVTRISTETCEYVARYALKKQKGKTAKMYEDLGIVPEFFCMSRRPGIGKQYFDENIEEIYKNDKIVLPSQSGAFTTKVPKYFDSLLERIDPYRLAEIKGNRKINAIETGEHKEYVDPFLDEELIYKNREESIKDSIIWKKESMI